MSGPSTAVRVADALVVVGGSAGAIAPLLALIAALPASLPAAIVIVQHSTPDREPVLAKLLRGRSSMIVQVAADGDTLCEGHVYVIPHDQHARVTAQHQLRLSNGSRIRYVRSSANPLFESAATVYDGRVVAIVLSGTGQDATDGVQAVKRCGGTVIVQSPAVESRMPQSAVETGAVDLQLPIEEIAGVVQRLVQSRSQPA